MKTVYALITKLCNLSCPHCDVKNNEVDDFNHDKFMEQLRNFNGDIVFFGGECTLFPERLLEAAYDKEISKNHRSVSTNLINLNDDLLKLYKDIGSLATSWNPNRFNKEEYQIWLNHLNILADNDIKTLVLITLTEDLISIKAEVFMDIISDWNPKALYSIRFENYIGPETTPEFFERVDDWLCEVYKIWNSPIINSTPEYISKCYHDCSNIYTLEPNGTLKAGCTHIQHPYFPNECYLCDRVDVCKPCILQRYCSVPRKFLELTSKKD